MAERFCNPWRGEARIVVDGVPLAPRLTLGALAEIEGALGCGSLVALVERFETGTVSARDVMAVLKAGLMAGGFVEEAGRIGAARIEGGPLEAARVAARLIALAFAPPEAAEGSRDGTAE